MDSTKDSERKQTFGEVAVGLSFNPSGDLAVNRLKTLYAEIIDIAHEAQTAQMWAVKAATWRD